MKHNDEQPTTTDGAPPDSSAPDTRKPVGASTAHGCRELVDAVARGMVEALRLVLHLIGRLCCIFGGE